MTELACAICTRHLEQPAVACDACRNKADAVLVEIGHLHAELPDELEKGRTTLQRVSGSREAPLPLRVDPLDLSLPAPTGMQLWNTLRPEDQVGYVPVLAILDSWIRDWSDTRNMREHPPLPAGASMITWLRNRLDWAYQHHPAVDEFDKEIRELRGALRKVLGVSDTRPELLDVPCRKCEWRSLHNLPGQDRVECQHCGDLTTIDEHRTWIGLLAAGIRDGVVDIPDDTLLDTADAAFYARVKPELIRQWASRGLLAVADRTKRGRPLYRAEDIRTIINAKVEAMA